MHPFTSATASDAGTSLKGCCHRRAIAPRCGLACDAWTVFLAASLEVADDTTALETVALHIGANFNEASGHLCTGGGIEMPSVCKPQDRQGKGPSLPLGRLWFAVRAIAMRVSHERPAAHQPRWWKTRREQK